MRLSLEHLESREVPSVAWSTPVSCYPDGLTLCDATIAGDGGSARLVITEHNTDRVVLDTIAFNDDGKDLFRGGGSLEVIPGTQWGHIAGIKTAPDTIVVVPGEGGGGRACVYGFSDTLGTLTLLRSYAIPYGDTYRGGLQVVEVYDTLTSKPVAAFLPKGAGNAPHYIAMDLDTGEVVANFYAGDPNDLSGDATLDPLGGAVTTFPGKGLAIDILYGPPDPVTQLAPTRVFYYPSGVEIPISEFQ